MGGQSDRSVKRKARLLISAGYEKRRKEGHCVAEEESERIGRYCV